MQLVTPENKIDETAHCRAEELFRKHHQAICTQTDRLFVWIMAAQWVGSIFLAFSSFPPTNGHAIPRELLISLGLGIVFCGFPFWMGLRWPGGEATRFVIAVGQVLISALLLHLTGGRTVTYFHVFASLAILGLYRNWKIILCAAAILIADYLFQGSYWPQLGFGRNVAKVWSWADYLGWISFECAFLILSIRTNLKEMFEMARQQVELQTLNETIERKVMDRTAQLKEENSERKRVQASLRLSEERFRSLSESSPVGIFQMDLRGNCVYGNSKWQSLMGLQHSENMGLEWINAIHPDDKPDVVKKWEECSKELKEYAQEFRMMARDGSVRWIAMRAGMIQTEGAQTDGYVGTAEDVTERKSVEEELRKAHAASEAAARAKSEFLANMSHEIRTPMNGVIGMTNLLLDTDLNAQQQEYAQTIHSSGEALLTIVNDILDFSKIEANKLVFETLDFDLQETVEGALELVAERAHSKNLELVSFILPDVPRLLRGDPGRLRQVLTNLVTNAVKFTEKGEVVVCVANLSETETHANLRFEIKDTGIGIPKEVQKNLFQAFHQADGSTTRKYGGTGLGLVISRQLVQLMDGQIEVDSTPGKGSVFWFNIRIEKQKKGEPQPAQHKNTRVLIVDDNATSREILQHHARVWHMRSSAVGSGREALDLLHENLHDPFNVAIIDMNMPGMNGLDLAKSIKEHPETANTRIVLLTGLGKLLTDEQLKKAGVDAALVKPVKQNKLYQCLTGDQAISVPKSEQTKSETGAQKMRILLVEDNTINQKVAQGQLRKLGFSADVCANGLEALEAVKRIPYDVILMDCQMPEMDGYEATRQIRLRESQEQTKHVYIVAMTAHAMDGDREKCMAAGMDDFVSKPVREADFKSALARGRLLTSTVANAKRVVNRNSPNQHEQKSIVDTDVLSAAANDDPEQLQELVELYLAQATDLMNGLRRAINNKAAKDVDHFAHKLVGASLACGMTAMIFPLRELEKRGKDNKLDDAGQFFDQANGYLQMTRGALTEFLSENPKTLARNK